MADNGRTEKDPVSLGNKDIPMDLEKQPTTNDNLGIALIDSNMIGQSHHEDSSTELASKSGFPQDTKTASSLNTALTSASLPIISTASDFVNSGD